ncbi:TPA: CaiF/GrlA family transcriptional regulator [Klebsiella variicola]|nr:CaiF/GrlA family transcriptional regulator [Klebsiella variicola]
MLKLSSVKMESAFTKWEVAMAFLYGRIKEIRKFMCEFYIKTTTVFARKSSRKPQPYILPPEVEGTACESAPLYLAVAYWAYQQKKAVTVSDVRKSFNISFRRASDLLEYLMEQGSKVVSAECYLLSQPTGCRLKRRAWRVHSLGDNYL